MCFAPLIFLSESKALILLGIALWGIGMGAEDSVMKAAVSHIVPKNMRSTGFGIFETGFGIAWFFGSWLLGALYDIDPVYLVVVSVIAQGLSVVFYLICVKSEKRVIENN